MGGQAGTGFNIPIPIKTKEGIAEMVKQPMNELKDVSTAGSLAEALEKYKQQQLNASSMPEKDQVNRAQAAVKSEPLGAPMKTDNPTVANKRSGNFAMSLEEFMKKQKGQM
jgi:hypothetical protein